MRQRPTYFHQLALLAIFCLIFATVAMLAGGARAEVNNNTRQLGDSRVFAPFPAGPGFPEAAAVNGDRAYVSGPARFGKSGKLYVALAARHQPRHLLPERGAVLRRLR